jgi:hypothetical protein
MKSIVVNVRLSAASVCAAGEFIEKGGADLKTQPVSTTVRVAFETMMEYLETQGRVTHYSEQDDEDVTASYRSLFIPDRTQPDIPSTPIGTDLSDLLAKHNATAGKQMEREVEEEPALDVAEIAAAVETLFDGESSPDIQIVTGRTETVEARQKINLFSMDRMEIEEVASISPNDPNLKMLAGLPEDHPLLRQAILITFRNLSNEVWGTKVFDSTVETYLGMHDGSEPE